MKMFRLLRKRMRTGTSNGAISTSAERIDAWGINAVRSLRLCARRTTSGTRPDGTSSISTVSSPRPMSTTNKPLSAATKPYHYCACFYRRKGGTRPLDDASCETISAIRLRKAQRLRDEGALQSAKRYGLCTIHRRSFIHLDSMREIELYCRLVSRYPNQGGKGPRAQEIFGDSEQCSHKLKQGREERWLAADS